MYASNLLLNSHDHGIDITITFAQANEHDIALDIMHDRPERVSRTRFDAHIRRSEETRPQMRI